MYIGSLQFLAS